MTVSSFTSVSLEPPLILVCLRTEAQVTRSLLNADYFGVNVLCEDQDGISRQFAQRCLADRFHGISWHRGPHSVPVLDEVLAHLVCLREDWLTRGDHVVLFGRVIDGSYSERGRPLIHWASNYQRVRYGPGRDGAIATPLSALPAASA